MANVTCTGCNGTKQQFLHIHYFDKPHKWEYFPCKHCEGTGEMGEERLEWEREGKEFQRWKIDKNFTLRELAATLPGETVVTLSNYMRGREKMPDTIKELMKGGVDANR